MTQEIDDAFVGQLLNDLEDLELPLLSWGVTDGALSHDEVLEAIERAIATRRYAPKRVTAEDMLGYLQNRALLFQVPQRTPRQYRTRFAETLRLTAQLRQLFPPRMRPDGPPPNWWQNGKRLVADYRLHTAARRYPRRDISPSETLQAFAQVDGWRPLQGKTVAEQIGPRSLARFQVEAARTIFGCLSRRRSSGAIVGAGTGSGKTLAFYLPAFAAMAEQARAKVARVHTLALYPRKELLRDQLREAVLTAQTVEHLVVQEQGRPLRIGALYGDTPWTREIVRQPYGGGRQQSWPQHHDGVICPYLACPDCATGDLLWSDRDRNANSERLSCQRCGHVIPDGLLALTRQSLQNNPPDLLFTTTEMLNRLSTNPTLGPMLGWMGRNPPSLVLLDEVHTYSGPHGAQVGLLLRRWRHAARSPVTFVGLSATLKEADRFFAQLTGLPQSDVRYIEPTRDSLEEEGREYAIALRGDPVAGASLLSTSIQTAMLFGRALDPESQAFLFGSKGFLFTDDLDVTNRFYDDLRDAEGGQSRTGQRGRGRVLAGLRSPDLPRQSDRYRDGQSWDIVDKIGRYLDPSLQTGEMRIGRTSSQDAGVDLDADLTVATASLEVGFDDPRVGLILQHKAPHDAAAFIQRRGRAARRRGTRPLTVITLSDYGRDRLAYQGYEALFAPKIPARSLPIGNRYVLKIQATQALLDWLGSELWRSYPRADPRRLLTAPRTGIGRQEDEEPRQWLVRRLEDLLTNSGVQDDLALHLQEALQVNAEEVQALLWEQPRSLLLAVVPTALRRLRSNWRSLRNDPGATPDAMLPEFVTPSLFDPLNVPGVEFDLPFDTGRDGERLPIAKALQEAVPGRVSRRYGYARDEHRTWVPLPESGHHTLELSDAIFPDFHSEGRWHPIGYDSDGVEVLRPYRIKLDIPPTDITDRSQAYPQWGTEILIPDNNPPSEAEVPDPSPWRSRIVSMGFATHAAGNPIEIRRMTFAADCDVSYRRGNERRLIRYTREGKPAALGFRLDVDAVRIQIAPLDLSKPSVKRFLASPEWRSQAFFHAVTEDATLAEVANTFQRSWLALIYITAFSLAGLDGSHAPGEIPAVLADGSWRDNLREILRVLYRDDQSAGQGSPTTDRLVAGLTELSTNPTVVAALDRAGQFLVAEDIAERSAALAQRAYRDTLAAAILAATLRACPDAQDSDLAIDVLPEIDASSPATIWLSETSIGGLGIIEHLVGYYTEDPRRFWTLVAGALQPNEYEYTDTTLKRLLQHVVKESPNGPAATAIAKLRTAPSIAAADHALDRLRVAWTELDGPPSHSAVATLSTRLLRPGSSAETDAVTLQLVDEWGALEQRLGFEVDARVIAYMVGSGRLRAGTQQRLSADQVFSMLWPRGAQARNHHLQHYQPYVDIGRPVILDRLLVEAAHDERLPQIQVTELGWEQHYQQTMAETGLADLVCPAADRRTLGDALARIPALHVDRDVLRVYGEVRSIARYGNEFKIRVELREALQ